MIYRAVMTSSHGPSVFRGQTILSIIIYQGCFPGTANTTFFTFGPKNRQNSFFFTKQIRLILSIFASFESSTNAKILFCYHYSQLFQRKYLEWRKDCSRLVPRRWNRGRHIHHIHSTHKVVARDCCSTRGR